MGLFSKIGKGLTSVGRTLQKASVQLQQGITRTGRTIRRATRRVGTLATTFANNVRRTTRRTIASWRGQVRRAVTRGAGNVQGFLERTGRQLRRTGEAVGQRVSQAVRNFIDPPDVQRQPPSEYGNADGLFSIRNMQRLIGRKVQGADSPRLNELMHELSRDPQEPELTRVLNDIADIRGVPRQDFRAQYDRYVAIRDEQRRIGEANDQEPPEALSTFHQDFMGSTPQLRYGSVVGQAMGIDPVFGALLNPTGGLVGPGNVAARLDDNDPVGYHGIVHDAAGYLFNYHNTGPGYDYLKVERRVGVDPGSPLAGQVSGIGFWSQLVKVDALQDTASFSGDLIRLGREARASLSRPGLDVVGLARTLNAGREAGLGLLGSVGNLMRHSNPGGLGYTAFSLARTVAGGILNLIDAQVQRAFAGA